MSAEMYAGRVAGESRWVCAARPIKVEEDGTDGRTDRRTDARSLHYAYRKTRHV